MRREGYLGKTSDGGVVGKRRKGKPEQRWMDSIKYDFTDLSGEDALGRAVANGPVGPAMAGPIIEPVIFIYLFFI